MVHATHTVRKDTGARLSVLNLKQRREDLRRALDGCNIETAKAAADAMDEQIQAIEESIK